MQRCIEVQVQVLFTSAGADVQRCNELQFLQIFWYRAAGTEEVQVQRCRCRGAVIESTCRLCAY